MHELLQPRILFDEITYLWPIVGLPTNSVKEASVINALLDLISLSTHITMVDECILFRSLHAQNFVWGFPDVMLWMAPFFLQAFDFPKVTTSFKDLQCRLSYSI